MVLTRFEIASKKEMHGKDQAKWFKLIFERRLGEITIDRDMTKEMLRRRKNFEVAISKKRQFIEVKKMVLSGNTEGLFKMIGLYDT